MRSACAITFSITLFSIIYSVFSVNNLREEFTWTRIDYDWGSSSNNRRTRNVELEDRYGYNSNNNRPSRIKPQNYQEENISFQNSESSVRPNGGRPINQEGRRPALPQNQGGSNWQSNNNDWNFQSNNNNNNWNQGSNNNGGWSSGSHERDYIYQNNIPMGAAVHGDRLFITVPRRRHGVPSTLNYVRLSSQNKHNLPLIPYPSWELNGLPENYNSTTFITGSLSQPDRDKFVSVYRVAIDSCDRMWFVDTGRMEIPNAPVQVQEPKLVIIDLRRDQVIRQFVLPQSVLRSNSQIAHIVVETEPNNCRRAHAYMPDLAAYGLVVYDFMRNRAWRVTHNYFYLEPLMGEFQVAGHHFQWNDGIFSTALSPSRNGRRDLYFHSLAGSHIYRVSTEVLKNETSATRSYHGEDFENLGDRGQGSQTSVSALDAPTGVLFLGLVNQNALACWNTNSPLSDISIVQRDDERMIYPCDLKVYNDNIYLLTNTMPAFLYGRLDYDQTNFRIWVQNVREAIDGTNCTSRTGNRGGEFRSGNRGGSSGGTKGGRSNRKGSTSYGVVGPDRGSGDLVFN